MTVTRAVILDLLPLYLAGEASPETMQLVEAYLASDPVLAGDVARQREAFGTAIVAPPAPDEDLAALRRTRTHIAARQWAFGLAWFFTALSMSVEWNHDRAGLGQFRLLVIDYWRVLWWIPSCALIAWAIYLRLRRRSRI
jgi:hypothetical protein